jgi:hypothetical protein
MSNNPTDQTLFDDAKRLYELHHQLANKYAKILSILNEGNNNVVDFTLLKSTEISNTKPHGTEKHSSQKRKKPTFESKVLKLLSDGKPRSTRQIRRDLEKTYGEKLTSRNVSSQLGLVRKNSGTISNEKFPDNPIEIRNLWGLPEWFENRKLKPEFLKLLDNETL